MTAEPRRLSAQRIALNQCHYFERRYSSLKELDIAARLDTAETVFQLYVEHVKLIDPVAADLPRMNMYREVLKMPANMGMHAGAARALARIYAGRGLAHHAVKLFTPGDALHAEYDGLLQQHNAHYGRTFDIAAFPGMTRGNCLVHYFAAHPDLLKGRRIAHFAPEAELRAWIAANAGPASYIAIDGFQPGMDRYEDLCAMTADDGAYDAIICHRVLEHVIDGASAHKELYRVLKRGGVLSISVPESLYLAHTAEWVVPDPHFHHHLRIYGRDFPDQLRAAGFRVERADWLLGRTDAELQAAKAYPMLLYNAFKD